MATIEAYSRPSTLHRRRPLTDNIVECEIKADHKKAILNATTKADIQGYQMDIDSYDVEFKRVTKPKLVIKKKPATTASK